MRLSLIVVFVCLATGWAADLNEAQQKRIEKLEKSLLAPCCYAEPVYGHRSEMALAMKAEISRLVSEGKSDKEILDLYKSRYGLRVLVEPEGGRWWWMHVVPAVTVLLGLLFVVWLIRRMLRPIPASSL